MYYQRKFPDLGFAFTLRTPGKGSISVRIQEKAMAPLWVAFIELVPRSLRHLLLYSFPSPEDDFGPVASYDIEPQPLNLTPHSKSSECWARRLEVHLPDPGWQKPARLAIGRSVNQLCRIMLRSLAETSLLIRLCGYSHSNMSSI